MLDRTSLVNSNWYILSASSFINDLAGSIDNHIYQINHNLNPVSKTVISSTRIKNTEAIAPFNKWV